MKKTLMTLSFVAASAGAVYALGGAGALAVPLPTPLPARFPVSAALPPAAPSAPSALGTSVDAVKSVVLDAAGAAAEAVGLEDEAGCG